ncbi:hypothetical protein LPJ53_004151, partial [Coemansia erecta]
MSKQRPPPGTPPRAPSPAPAPDGPTWSTVLVRGGPPNTGQRGTSQNFLENPARQANKPTRVDNGTPFSALHLIEKTGTEADAFNVTTVPPVRIVPNQHDYPCLGYSVPAGATYTDIQDMFIAKQDKLTSSLHLTFYCSSRLAVIRFRNDKDRLTFLSEQIEINGVPAQLSQFQAYSPEITFVTLTGLQEADPRNAATKIHAALGDHGRIIDIVLYKRGPFLSSLAQVVVSLPEGKTIDGLVELGNYNVTALGKCVDKACVYCKTKGHTKAECRNRPQ